jgi:hypothetical protein
MLKMHTEIHEGLHVKYLLLLSVTKIGIRWQILIKLYSHKNLSSLILESLHMDDDDSHYVKGVRLCLWTAATSGPTVHPPGDLWAWRTMVKWCQQGKTPDSSTRPLWQSYQQSYLVARQEELAKERKDRLVVL